MPVSPYLGFSYPTPLDPATADLWGDILNTLFLLLDTDAGSKSIDQNFNGHVLTNPKVKRATEFFYDAGNVSGTVTLDYVNGNYQRIRLTGNVTSLSISNWPASGTVGFMTLKVVQDGTGNHTLTLGSAYKTPGGAGIVLSTLASAYDKLRLETDDAGTTIDTVIAKAFA